MKRVSQRGYNLIELLVAIAILGIVMLTILSLFIWGRKNVYSGKQMTAAIAVGTRVLEDLAPLTKEDIYAGVFSIAGTSTGNGSVTFGNPAKTYTNAAFRSTKTGIVTGVTDLQTQNTNGPKFLDTWRDQLTEKTGPLTTDTRLRLDDGAVTLIMMPRAGSTTPAQFSNASVMQIRVVVSWIENRRRREVILDSVKTQ